jgi:hypothetical protein
VVISHTDLQFLLCDNDSLCSTMRLSSLTTRGATPH